MTSSTAWESLLGLTAGDAFGAQFFVPDNLQHLHNRTLPSPVWPWTDDTEMACVLLTHLQERGAVDASELLGAFARHHDFDRGYGPAMNRLLRLVRQGEPASPADLFDGQGSWGNGAAMRVAPLGAFFAGDLKRAAAEARASAVSTHTHPEAAAGAIAVAVAAGIAVRCRGDFPSAGALLRVILDYVPPGRVHDGIAEAALLVGQPVELAAHRLGNGRQVSAADTVPFALWAAASFLGDFGDAMWATVSAGGDVDTTCAIVGGILGAAGTPVPWLDLCEPLPAWASTE